VREVEHAAVVGLAAAEIEALGGSG
jgi:hypothetical protein